jgi:S-DNA-T family DNA segregation ATPase FtsK/SpoIIIE
MSVNPIGGITNVSSLLQPTAAQIAAAQGTTPGSATATAAQTAPTADAAQAWEEAMRAAMGDESSSNDSSSDPLSSLATQNAATANPAAALTGQAATAGSATSAASLATPSGGASLTGASAPSTTASAPSTTGTAGAQTALTPQALAALVSGSSTAPTNPLITSLSAPSLDTTPAQPVSDAGASSYL